MTDHHHPPVSSGKGNESKDEQMGLNETKQILRTEGNYEQNNKAAHWMGDACKRRPP